MKESKVERQSSNATPRLSGAIEKFGKRHAASLQPTSLFLVKKIYPEAIEYTGSPVGSRGLALFVGLLTAMGGLWASCDILLNISVREELRTVHIVGIFVALIFSGASIYLLAICVRLELFRPFDEPCIFDRKNRKVYLNYRQADLRWRGLLRRWSCRTDIYDWDNVHAEHHAVVNANAATVSRNHSLIFVVHRSRDDPGVIGQFVIGGIEMGELSVPAVWEHIRRFMEENGPHIPAGEPLMQVKPPTSLWQIVSDMGPYGRQFYVWWSDFPITTLLAIVFAPILVPGCILVSICAWISYRTAYRLAWPQEVLDAVGRPIVC
jgi:hypothetical protein